MLFSCENARFFLDTRLTWISARLISDSVEPPMVTSVSSTPGTARSLVEIASAILSVTPRAEPVGISSLTAN